MATQGEPTGGIRTVKASEFKAKCLELMDELAGSGGEIVITKNGKPVSRLVPYRVHGDPTSLFALDKGRVKITGDIVSPMPAEWFEDAGDTEENLL